MGDLRWRGDPSLCNPQREFIRRHMMGPSVADPMTQSMSGLVVEDLDLAVRGYGPRFGIDGEGRFRLIELKHYGETVKNGQARLFGLLDKVCQAGDDGFRYDGFYVVRADDVDWEKATRWVVTSISGGGDVVLNRAEFIRWFQFDVEMP